jgi:uncharacterized protein (TIGR00661 family)
MKQILYGICGIGHGHVYRQLPLLTHLALSHRIAIFAYGESLTFCQNHFAHNPNVTIIKVAVRFYVGGPDGIDMKATAIHPHNQQDFDAINAAAMAQVDNLFGAPDLVITDYEPICAQYAYTHNVPLITLDQQSKYLSGDFPPELNNTTYGDEVARLRLFFPTATQRVACSFFDVAQQPDALENVTIIPPILRAELINLKRQLNHDKPRILVYFTSQEGFKQSLPDILDILASQGNVHFDVICKESIINLSANVTIYPKNTGAFESLLAQCHGIISTAGHGLLSEAMHLGIPVYAMPLDIYEQQANAHIINQGAFGLSSPTLNAPDLQKFISNLSQFSQNIANGRTYLLRQDGLKHALKILQSYL